LTVADVQRVAENYLKETNRTFGQFVPTKTLDRTEIPATPDVAKLVAGYQGKAAVAEGESFDVTPANIDKRTQNITLGNGLKVSLISKKTRANTVSGQFVLEFGDEKSLNGHFVDADLISDMLLRGAGKLSRSEINTQLDALKAKLTVGIADHGQGLVVRFDTIRKNLPELLNLLRDVLRAPSFPAADFEQLKAENITAIESQKSDPTALASNELNRAFNAYKKGDVRYVLSFDEQIDAIKKAKLADLKRFHETAYGANNGKLSIVGDFDAKEVETQIQSLFGNWTSRAKFTRLASPAPAPKPGVKQIETPDKANAFFIAGLPLKLQDNSPDYPTLAVINNILGGSVQSRLMTRLRHKDGMSYGAGSQITASSFEANGMVTLFAMYAPQNFERVKIGVQEELERFVKDGITEQELIDAKKGIMQQRQTSRAQDGVLATVLVNNLKASRTMAFAADSDAKIQALTLEQVNAAIKKYIEPTKFLQLYAGDFAGAAKKPAVTK